MTKHIESEVPCAPVRDADRSPGTRAVDRVSDPSDSGRVGPLVPVREIPGLTPREQVAELRLRVQSGVYCGTGVLEQVARAMQARGFQGRS